MMPSSHSRAVANSECDSMSKRFRISARIASRWAGSGALPARAIFSSVTMRITVAACSPPITATRALGQAKTNCGS